MVVTPAKLHRLSWLLYDFANNSFSVMIVTFVYPVYFKSVVCAGLGNLGDLLWGINGSLSLVVVAVLSPLLGAVADLSGRKKSFLIASGLLCIFLTLQLAWVGSGMIFWGMAIFIAANIVYQTGQVFYNAFLPDLASPQEVGRLSGYGWASAYLGGTAVLLVAIPLLQNGAPEKARFVFILTALFYLVFSLPAFLFLPSAPPKRSGLRWGAFLSAGFQQVKNTLSRLDQYRQLSRFLLAYFVYMEGVSTIVYYTSIYAQDTLGFTVIELVYLYLVLQTVGVGGAVGFGLLGDRIGPRATLILILILWSLVGLVAAFTYSKMIFWFVASAGALCLASVQAVSRSMIALMVRRDQQAEIFGFYGISGKLSSAFGPLLFGLTSLVSGSQRAAMLAVGMLFLAGLLLLLRVEEPRKRGELTYGG
ncbi:MAG: MFS transporter [Deltaproteobacteria bacterium]|nr:MFS transporter [Deltaproteobacteria bacterium]